LLSPFPLAYDVLILAALKEGGLSKDETPKSDMLPPCILAGIIRSIYDLIAEIPRRTEAGWSVYDDVLLEFWNREGPYLYPKISPKKYDMFAGTCLDAGLVISPDYDIPSVVPWKANKGELSALCNKVKSFYIL
jgi:hypothetical protein